MAEENTGAPGAVAGTPSNVPAPPAATPTLEDLNKEVEKWKALSRKNEERATSNASAADELQKIKDGQLSDVQKAQKAAEKAAGEAATAKAELARYRVAAAKGVPAELLTGTDDDTLNAQADALLKFAGHDDSSGPDLGQGIRGGNAPADPNAWLRRMAGR